MVGVGHKGTVACTCMTTAFVLSGGGSLGAVQVGMLQALQARDFAPDLLVGTSVGALNAAFVASQGFDADALKELERIWVSLRRRDVFPVRAAGSLLALAGRRVSLCTDTGLRRLLSKYLAFERLEDAPTSIHVIATNLRSGEEVQCSTGDATSAILASAAVPGVFPPVEREGKLLCDGAIADNAPISNAVALGADRIVVLPSGYPCATEAAPRTALGNVLQAVALLIQQRLITDVAQFKGTCDLMVLPPLCPLAVGPADFHHSAELVTRAREFAGMWLDEGKTNLPNPERFLSLHDHHVAER